MDAASLLDIVAGNAIAAVLLYLLVDERKERRRRDKFIEGLIDDAAKREHE